ncbi:MAG: FAD:protein FMN transferase [Clostridia bacterium]|nr:FAD:protein FMN transferase [Clostridia bacterium]MBR7092176.1 FAD:protein FMN transferase [Clostridia bacterium]
MKRLICAGLCLLLLLAGGCGRLPGATRSGFALDTVVSVTLYGTDDEALLDGCFALIREKEALFSRTVPDSDVARINAAAGQPVTVTEETAALLRTALIFCEASGGAFDVTVGALTQLWDFGADTPFLPAADAVTTALATVSYAGLSVKGNTVTLVNKDARLDLGGIAKGYIADCLRDYLTQHGVTSALLDLGGSITVLGDKQGQPFRIGIRAPDDADGLLGVVPVCGGSVVTSGDYERCRMVEGVRYHHLLDPATGYPARTGLRSVSIIGPSAAVCDALSTACFVLGEEKARLLLLAQPGYEAVFARNDGTVTHTDGLDWQS